MTSPTPGAATDPGLVATCWTSAGDVRPLDEPEVSPFPAADRVRAVAAAGFTGMGFAHDDLVVVRDGEGFAALAAEVTAAGLTHVEVELAGDWWLPDPVWRPRWELLLAAADALGARVLKVGTRFGAPLPDVGPLVAPLRRLAVEAADHGVRLALEPLPFAAVASLPQGAGLVAAVDHPACGLAVDAWHVFRAGTSLPDLAACLASVEVVQVELDDADPEVVGTLFEDTRDHRRYPGEGSFDLAGFVEVVRGTGFTGPWGVEILSDAHRALPLDVGLARARDAALAVLRRA